MTFLLLTVALAHPWGPDDVSRSVQLHVHADQIEVRVNVMAHADYLLGNNDSPSNETRQGSPTEHFAQHHAVAIGKQLSLVVAQQKTPLRLSSIDLLRRHHAELQLTYVAKCSVREATSIEFTDSGATSSLTYYRLACRGRSGVTLSECSVPANLQRIPLVKINEMPTTSVEKMGRLTARAVPPAVEIPAASTSPPTQRSIWIIPLLALLCLLWLISSVWWRLKQRNA